MRYRDPCLAMDEELVSLLGSMFRLFVLSYLRVERLAALPKLSSSKVERLVPRRIRYTEYVEAGPKSIL